MVISSLLMAAIDEAAKDSKILIQIKSQADIIEEKTLGMSVAIKIFQSAPSVSDFGDELAAAPLDGGLRLGYIQSGDRDYDACVDLLLKRLKLNVTTIPADVKSIKESDYDMVFARTRPSFSVKHLSLLPHPLYPSSVLSSLLEFGEKKDSLVIKKPKILLLDENQISLNLSKIAFEKFDFAPHSLNDASRLNSVLLQDSFDILFIDSQTSADMKSIVEKYRAYEAQNSIERIAIIALLSNTSSYYATDIDKDSNFDGHIKKPISVQKLQVLLANFIDNLSIFVKKNAQQSERILIYKKTKVQNQIYLGALKDYVRQITAVESIDDFARHLRSEAYRIVMIDDDAMGYDTQSVMSMLISSRESFDVNTKLFIFSANPPKAGLLTSFVKTFGLNISKSQIQAAVSEELEQ